MLQNINLIQSLNYTTNTNKYVCQHMVLESVSNLRMSNITFDLGFRIKYAILLAVEIDGGWASHLSFDMNVNTNKPHTSTDTHSR